MQTIYLDPAMVPQALRGAYSGKKFKAVVTATVTIPADAGLWSGGSRDCYNGVELATGQIAPLPMHSAAPWDLARRDLTFDLMPGYAVVRSTMFQGKDLGLTFYVHPDNAAQLLPAPSAELSPHEKLVLLATRRFKASYGGRNRYEMARNDYACEQALDGADYPSAAQWDEAKRALIARGYLNKAGAITVSGRNAAQ